MKRIVTALAVLAVSINLLFALSAKQQAQSEPVKVRVEKEGVADNAAASAYRGTNLTFTPSTTPYAGGSHGFSMYRMEGDRISWDPNSGLYGTTFDIKSTSGIKSTGAMASKWGEGDLTEALNKSDDTGLWFKYPDICGIDKYKVATLPTTNTTPDGTSLFISVYDADQDAWTPRIPVKAGTSTPAKVTACHSSMTKDGSGNYYLLLSIVYEHVAYADRKLALIVGKTTDPFAGTWTFSDYTENKFVVNATGQQLTEASPNFRAAWGKNGFGFAAIECKTADYDFSTVGYVYTKNYGQTWEKNGDGKMFIVQSQSLFPWVGTKFGTDSTLIEKASLASNIAVNVDQNNDAHVMVHAWGGSGTNYYPNLAANHGDVPVSGYYNLKYKFDANGLPEAGAAWKANLIAQGVGMLKSDSAATTAEKPTESAYINNRALNISCGNDGLMMASWTDRPVEDPKTQVLLGDKVGIPQDNWHYYIHNPYINYSFDGGETWASSRTDVKRGFEIKTYTDNFVQELGFGIAGNCKLTVNGQMKSIETYAAYAIPNLAAPSPAALGVTPGSEHSFWEQNWYVMQIKIDTDEVGIEATPVALTKNFALEQNYPNPFNPTTAINFNLKNTSNVKLTVFNAKGEVVSNLINAQMTQGAHSASFNAANLNSGVYFYKLTVDGQSAVKKMVLTK